MRNDKGGKTFVITKGMKIFHIYKDYSNREPQSHKNTLFNPYSSRGTPYNEQMTSNSNYLRPYNSFVSTGGNDTVNNANNTYGSFTVINSNFTPFNNHVTNKEYNEVNSYGNDHDARMIVKNEGSYDLENEADSKDEDYDESYKGVYDTVKINASEQNNDNNTKNEVVEDHSIEEDESNLNEVSNIPQDNNNDVEEYGEEGNYLSRYDRFS